MTWNCMLYIAGAWFPSSCIFDLRWIILHSQMDSCKFGSSCGAWLTVAVLVKQHKTLAFWREGAVMRCFKKKWLIIYFYECCVQRSSPDDCYGGGVLMKRLLRIVCSIISAKCIDCIIMCDFWPSSHGFLVWLSLLSAAQMHCIINAVIPQVKFPMLI